MIWKAVAYSIPFDPATSSYYLQLGTINKSTNADTKMNPIYTLQKEGYYDEFIQVHITITSVILSLFNIGYLIAKLYHITRIKSAKTAKEIKFKFNKANWSALNE